MLDLHSSSVQKYDSRGMMMLHHVCTEDKYINLSMKCSQRSSAATKLPKNQFMQVKLELKSLRG